MGWVTAAVMEKSLLLGAVILGLAILGGIFHFLRLGLFSAGLEKKQAGIVSGVVMALAGALLYRKFFG